MEVHCQRCGYWDPHHATGPGQDVCPGCQARLSRRVGTPPGPATYLRPLIRSIFSVTGLITLGLYAVLDSVPIGRLRVLVAVLLYATAVKLAYRAMAAAKGEIHFPVLSPHEVLEGTSVGALALYVLLFIVAPANLLVLGVSNQLVESFVEAEAPEVWEERLPTEEWQEPAEGQWEGAPHPDETPQEAAARKAAEALR
ncbi:MAG: hypothetical protein AB2A00_17415, partial [Myxococcota bacterium]